MYSRAQMAFVVYVAASLILLSSTGCERVKPARTVEPPTIPSARTAVSPTVGSSTTTATEVVVAQAANTQAATETLAPTPTVLEPTATPASSSTPEPTLTPSPTAPPYGETEYVVRAGDTLLAIASRFNTTTQAIMSLNGLSNPNQLKVGQVLRIPNAAPPETSQGNLVTYVVKSGDTLASLARTYRTTVADILETNPGISSAQRLQVGVTLYIPEGTNPDLRTHVVRSGENLASIALKYGVTVQELVNANGLTNPNKILVGQVLIIP